MANDKLTKQQEIFVQELLKNKSQIEAYKIAYPKAKMSDDAIYVEASNMKNGTGKYSQNPKISLRYNELSERLKREAEDECIVDAKEVLRELKSIGFSRITDYAKIENNRFQVFDTDDISTEKIAAISEIKETKDGLQFKLHNKVSALEDIARILGMFKDSLDVKVEKPIDETIDEIEDYIESRNEKTFENKKYHIMNLREDIK